MEKNRVLTVVAVSLAVIVAALVYFSRSREPDSPNLNQQTNEIGRDINDGENKSKLDTNQQSGERVRDVNDNQGPLQTISASEDDGLELPALPYNSEYDVLGSLDIAAAMQEWEKFHYTDINGVAIISEIAGKLNIKTKTEVSEEQIEKCRTNLKTFLTMYSGKSGDTLLKLHGISDPSEEYDLQDDYTKEKMELAKQGLLQLGVNSNEIPADYQDRWTQFADVLYEKMGPSITGIAVDESHLVVNKLTKDKYDPREWDPRDSSASSLNRIYTLLSDPQGSANSVLSGSSFLEKMQTPQDVLYVDLRLYFKAGVDLANHGVFRFVWDESISDWRPMSAIWFYNGPREQYYFFW